MPSRKVIRFLKRCVGSGLISQTDADELADRVKSEDLPDAPQGTEHQFTEKDIANAAKELRDILLV